MSTTTPKTFLEKMTDAGYTAQWPENPRWLVAPVQAGRDPVEGIFVTFTRVRGKKEESAVRFVSLVQLLKTTDDGTAAIRAKAKLHNETLMSRTGRHAVRRPGKTAQEKAAGVLSRHDRNTANRKEENRERARETGCGKGANSDSAKKAGLGAGQTRK